MNLRKKMELQWMTLSRAERNGTLVLSCLLVFLISLRLVQDLAQQERHRGVEIGMVDEIQLDFLDLEVVGLDSIEKPLYATTSKAQFFDPNTVSERQLVSMGVPGKTAQTLIKYRSSGAVFRQKSDLMKVYGLDSVEFKRLEPWVRIESSKRNVSKEEVKLEINSADSADWVKLKGIGPVYASRICKYRNYLGGFVDIDQLKEVYHLPPETIESLKQELDIDTSLVRRISLKFTDYKELAAHPYCNYSQAKEIIQYRSEKGSALKLDELKQILDDETNVLFLKYLKE